MTQQFHSWAYTQENWKKVLEQTLVHEGSYIIHNRQKLETALLPFGGRTNKQNVVYLYNRILFSH